MKKFILSAFFLGAMFTAQAQTNLTGTAATVRTVLSMSATEMSRQMYNDLQLNEGQYVKIKALNQARFDKFSEIEKMYANDAQMRDAKIKEVNAQLDQEFASILTPKQFTSYLEFDGRPVETAPATDSTMDQSAPMNFTKPTEAEMKIKDDKIKVEGEDSKVKIEGNKIKAESSQGEMKMKNDSEKLKTESVKYKSSPTETKIKTAEGKSKVEMDKVKTKTETTKKKVKN